jgi:acyl-CoA thioester hydrolase
MSDEDKPSEFIWRVRIYYEDTDAGGVVYYANYLKYFERARTEWLRAAGIGQQVLAQSHGVAFVVRHINVDFHAPAKLDDELKLTLAVEKMGRASVHFLQQAWRDGELLVSAKVRIACISTTALRACGIPGDILEKIGGSK